MQRTQVISLVFENMNEKGAWKKWASSLRNNTYALYLASRDPRVPLAAKVITGFVVAYALSPIDLIPDFIPIIGYLDDLVLLPLAIWLAIRLIPKELWRECQALAVERFNGPPYSRRAAAVIILIWILAIIGFMLWLWKLLN
jgi:uncharacterized membrane protein YkvA (DUF1232 family)